MRADRVEFLWDKEESSWLVRRQVNGTFAVFALPLVSCNIR